MKTQKAQVTEIQFGHFSFEGLLLPDGIFAIASTQVSDILELRKSDASRNIKTLLGKDFKLRKSATEITKNKIQVLTLEEFTLVIQAAAKKGNPVAINFAVMMMGLALEQLFCDAFNIRFEKEERQLWLKERQEGKGCRRSFTDAIKYLGEQGEGIDYAYMTMAIYTGCNLRERYLAYKAVNTDNKFRDTLTPDELKVVSKTEERAADFIMVDKLGYKEAIVKAVRYIR